MRALLLSTLLLFALTGAAATHEGGCTPGSTTPELDSGETRAGRYYVNYDPRHDWGPVQALWIYQESNGVAGQQRSDFFVDDTCGHPERADTLVF